MLIINENIAIPESELDISFSRSSGPGGQNVNKVNSKATLRWHVANSPSVPHDVKLRFQAKHASKLTTEGEVVIQSDSYRDQLRNIEDCKDKLRELLLAVARPPKKRIKTKPTTAQRARRLTHKKEHGEKKKNRKRVFSD
jgi:ribosome-associated protein